jgi:multiple sugar transport system substrate-binding protein
MPRDSTTRRSYLKWVGAGGAAGLAGCASGGGGGGGEETTDDGGESTTATTTASTTAATAGGVVNFLNDRSAREIWENAAAEFNSQSEYEVDITWLPKGTSSNEQVAKMRAAGNLPALIFESSTDCYRETKEGITTPLTDVVEELGVKNVVPVDGESYMVPAVAIPLIMTYRTDVVEGEPRTRSEWQAEAERIQAEDGASGYVVPSGRTNAATTHANQTLWNGGVDPYAGSGEDIEVLLDQGENREKAVESYEWLQTMDEFGPRASGWGWGDLLGALIQGQLVAWAGLGGLAIPELKANRPDLATKFAPAPYPAVEGRESTQWWSYFEGMYSYADAENTEGAREFLKFFLTSDYYFQFLRQTALFNFPTSLEGLRDDRYSSADLVDEFPDFLQLVEDNWDDMAPVLQTGDERSPNIVAANAYGQQMYGQSVDRMLYGDDSPGEAIDWLAEQLRTEMT